MFASCFAFCLTFALPGIKLMGPIISIPAAAIQFSAGHFCRRLKITLLCSGRLQSWYGSLTVFVFSLLGVCCWFVGKELGSSVGFGAVLGFLGVASLFFVGFW